MHARAFWVTEPGRGELRDEPLPPAGPDEVLIRTRFSGISRGTETLVFEGRVPPSEYRTMRAPFQDGDFPGPVKYGYLSVGEVEQGPVTLQGRTVFCLYPHQDRYRVPAASVQLVPTGVPARRAVLAGTVETALNALWDAPPLLGDRITVIGAGMVGCCVARLAVQVPGTRVTLVDVDPGRAELAAALGVAFATPTEAPDQQDLVVHASASAAGLQRALQLAADEATVLELSWYGDADVPVPLGRDFHARRLDLRASQVGLVAPARRARRTHGDRLASALELLRDDAFDSLIGGSSAFEDLPGLMAAGVPALCHIIDYER